mgnify:CR=1 FL=1
MALSRLWYFREITRNGRQCLMRMRVYLCRGVSMQDLKLCVLDSKHIPVRDLGRGFFVGACRAAPRSGCEAVAGIVQVFWANCASAIYLGCFKICSIAWPTPVPRLFCLIVPAQTPRACGCPAARAVVSTGAPAGSAPGRPAGSARWPVPGGCGAAGSVPVPATGRGCDTGSR